MRTTIRNFRGIRNAEIDLSRVALVGGPNAAGKSSVAMAVQAALSGEPVPLDGLKKSEAGALVHAGTEKGSVEITTDKGAILVSYPQAKVKTEGTPPAASPFALGRRHLVELPQKEAAAVLLEYLKAKPTEADVLAAAARIGLDEKQAAQLWGKIQDLGWDGQHAAAKETGIKLKAQWEHVAGERFGPAKAASWLPKGWETGIEAASEETLSGELAQAREFLEAAIAANAVSAEIRAQVQAQAAELPAHRAELERAETELSAAKAGVAVATKSLQDLPAPSSEEKGTPCPHCAQPVIVRGSYLAKPTPVDAAENQQRAHARAAAAVELRKAQELQQAKQTVATNAQRALQAAEKAAKRLSELPAHDGDAAQVELARENVQRAELRLSAFKSKRDADRLAQAAAVNADVLAMLAADGLRLTKLRDAVRRFNERLAALSELAGWAPVEFADDLSPTYGGRSLLLLSESERFRAAVTVQVALAQIDRSAAVVIDGADILDKRGRNGLMRLLLSLELPALVCMTLPGRDGVPALAADVGASYWIEGFTAHHVEGGANG